MLLPAPQPAGQKKRQKAVESAFSKAFDNFVGENPDDVEGLLAYALYKRTIRDRCRNGAAPSTVADRDAPRSEVQTYRDSARQMLEAVMQSYEAEAAPAWQRSYFEERLGEWKGEIKNTIRGRTSVAGQIIVNLVAWVITVILSLAVYFYVRTQTVDEIVRERVDKVISESQAQAPRDARAS